MARLGALTWTGLDLETSGNGIAFLQGGGFSMDLFGGFETIPGIHSDERFPLVRLVFAPLGGVLPRSVRNASNRFQLTFGRSRRHFLATYQFPMHGLLPLQGSDRTSPDREATIQIQPLRTLSPHLHPLTASGKQRVQRTSEQHSGERWGHRPTRSDRAKTVGGSPRDRHRGVDATH